jgi:hypothetical protein
MNRQPFDRARESFVALGLAALTTFGLLLSMGALADRYHTDVVLAQSAGCGAPQAAALQRPAPRG